MWKMKRTRNSKINASNSEISYSVQFLLQRMHNATPFIDQSDIVINEICDNHVKQINRPRVKHAVSC